MIEPDPLAGLRDQIRGATEAAERLLRDARPDPSRPRGAPRGPADAPPIPPAGWHQADEASPESEIAALLRIFERLREVLPAELQQQLLDLVRQVLVVLRALIDWAVNRLEADDRGRELDVEDIPID